MLYMYELAILILLVSKALNLKYLAKLSLTNSMKLYSIFVHILCIIKQFTLSDYYHYCLFTWTDCSHFSKVTNMLSMTKLSSFLFSNQLKSFLNWAALEFFNWKLFLGENFNLGNSNLGSGFVSSIFGLGTEIRKNQ